MIRIKSYSVTSGDCGDMLWSDQTNYDYDYDYDCDDELIDYFRTKVTILDMTNNECSGW